MSKYLITVPTLGSGGMERAVINTAKHLIGKKNEVTIFVISGGDIFYELPEGVKVYFGKRNIKDRLGIIKSLYKLRKLYKRERYNVILSFSGKHSSYILLSLLGLKSNTFVLHRASPYVTYGYINNILNKALYPKATALVVQTETAKKVFIEKYRTENVFVYPNPVRDTIDYNVNETKKQIISVGRLIESKGFIDLIEIFADINLKDWELVIVGDGPQRKVLEETINNLKLTGKVILKGKVNNIDNILKESRIFAFASKTEGFPNALLEAMCTGLPCISYDCQTGPSDIIIDNKNGYLVELNNKEEFKNKLLQLINNKDLRLLFSENSKKLKDKHSPERVVEEFIENINKYIN